MSGVPSPVAAPKCLAQTSHFAPNKSVLRIVHVFWLKSEACSVEGLCQPKQYFEGTLNNVMYFGRCRPKKPNLCLWFFRPMYWQRKIIVRATGSSSSLLPSLLRGWKSSPFLNPLAENEEKEERIHSSFCCSRDCFCSSPSPADFMRGWEGRKITMDELFLSRRKITSY